MGGSPPQQAVRPDPCGVALYCGAPTGATWGRACTPPQESPLALLALGGFVITETNWAGVGEGAAFFVAPFRPVVTSTDVDALLVLGVPGWVPVFEDPSFSLPLVLGILPPLSRPFPRPLV